MSGSVIGASVPMVNAREKVSGRARYVADMKMVGMLHGKVLRSPFPHARIVHIDTSRAKAVPGVKLVVTGADTPPYLWGPLRKEHRILAVDKVRFAGEEVAAVVAVDEWAALDALELIRVEYEELPVLLDAERALEPGALEIHDGTGNLAYEIRVARGDVDAGFRRAAAVYEATYEPTHQYAGYMEPMGTLAAVDERGRLTVWAPTQTVFYTRDFVADALGISGSDVRIIQTMVGGAFGAKNTQDANTPLTAFLALKTGKPVRVINNRLEDFLASRPGPSARIKLKMGLAKDGTIVAKDSTVIGDTGAYRGFSPRSMFITAMRSDSLHRLENVRTHTRLAYTNKLPCGSFRGMGNPLMGFALDSHLTMLAGMIGMDPVDVHLRNAIRTGDTSVHGWYMGSCGLSECLERARDGIGWTAKRGDKAGGRYKRGRGIGAAIHVSSNRHGAPAWDGSTIFVRINEDGRALMITGESELGQGAHTMLSQVCATELGIPIDHVIVQGADTDISPYSRGSIASRVTMVAGNAAILAARAARAKLLMVAAEKLDIPETELTIENSVIRAIDVPGRNRAVGEMTVAEAARAHLLRFSHAIYVQANFDSPKSFAYDPATYYGNISAGYSFAAQAVEVEVDTETGQVHIVDAFCADDCGKALNPMAVEGQTHGAMTQGIGWALYEHLQFEDGRLINADFADYTLPTADSVPEIRTALVESNEVNGPYGAKGASETAIVPTAGAIANAVYDAIGVRINSLPITPEKVLSALRATERKDA